MTPMQRQALTMVKRREIKGTCYRMVWRFRDANDTYTAQIRALEKMGLVSIMYFRDDEAAVNLTDKGREIARQ